MIAWSRYLPYFGWLHNQNQQAAARFNAKAEAINKPLSLEDDVECISLDGLIEDISSEKLTLSDQEKAIHIKIAQRVKDLKEAADDQDDQGSRSRNYLSNYDQRCSHENIVGNESRGLNNYTEESDPDNFSITLSQINNNTFEVLKPAFSKTQSPEIKYECSPPNPKSSEVAPGDAKCQDRTQGKLYPSTSLPTELHAPLKLQPWILVLLLMISFLITGYSWFFSNDNNNSCTLMAGSVAIFVLFGTIFLTVKTLTFGKVQRFHIKKIKWNLVNCKEQVCNGIVTSPPFKTVTARCCNYCRSEIEWRLIIQKEQTQNIEEKYLFGLLAVNIPPEVKGIFINFAFSAVDENGVDLSNSVEIKHNYTRTGDCAYSTPIKRFSSFNGKDGLLIQCKLSCEGYQTKLSGILRSLCQNLKMKFIISPNHVKVESLHTEHGRIVPVNLENVQQVGCSIDSPVNEFIRHCETQTFTWSIPCFQKVLKHSSPGTNKPFVLYSPFLYVVSHGVCSIWSLKLFEFQGIFRLHAKLRGLPSGTNRLQMNYIFQVQDSFGDFIIPDECGRRIQCGEYMKPWDYSRHLLYSRQTLLERFIQDDGSLCIRISLNLDPLETDLSPDFADWVLFQ